MTAGGVREALDQQAGDSIGLASEIQCLECDAPYVSRIEPVTFESVISALPRPHSGVANAQETDFDPS